MPKKVRGMLVYNNRIIDSLGSGAKEIEEELSPFFSEFGYAEHRFEIEAMWLYFLIIKEFAKLPEEYIKLHNGEKYAADAFINQTFAFDDKDFERILELERQIDDEEKVYEIFMSERLKESGFENLVKYIHLGCSNEEMNNAAHAGMVKDAKEVLGYEIHQLRDALLDKKRELIVSSSNNPHISAIATAVNTWQERLSVAFEEFEKLNLAIEFSGASKNYSTFEAIKRKNDDKETDVNWKELCRDFVERRIGFEFIDTSIFSCNNDSMYQIINSIRNINHILKLVYRWINYYHKVLYCPITREDISFSYDSILQNINISNAFIEKTIISLEYTYDTLGFIDYGNIGLLMGYSMKAIKQLAEFISKIDVDYVLVEEVFGDTCYSLANSVRVVLKLNELTEAEEKLNRLESSDDMTKEKLKEFIEALEISKEEKRKLL